MKLARLPIILGFLTLLLTLPAAILLLSKRQQTQVAAGFNKTALVYVWPQKFSLPNGEQTTIKINVETKNQPSKMAEATLKFATNLLKIEPEGISAPNGVTLNKKVVDSKRGIVELAGSGEFQTQKTLAEIKIRAMNKGKTKIEVTSAHVWDPSGTVDIFQSGRAAEIIIN